MTSGGPFPSGYGRYTECVIRPESRPSLARLWLAFWAHLLQSYAIQAGSAKAG